MNAEEPQESFKVAPRFGVRQWMSARWWVALVLSLIIILVMRSGTVGAPAEASARSLDSLPNFHARRVQLPEVAQPILRRQAELEQELRSLSSELMQTRSALAAERTKTELLKDGYDGLDARFQEVVGLVQSALVEPAREAEPSSAAPSVPVGVPVPIEAIYVTKNESSDPVDASSHQKP